MAGKGVDEKQKSMSLSSFIVYDLEKRISSGDPELEELSLKNLAEYYGVSITPVRFAISELVKRGIILKLKNRRLQINPHVEKLIYPQAPGDYVLPAVSWDELILKEVVKASLSDEPQYLRENTIAKKLGIGRSIVRQIFSNFSGAGLIDHIPRKGWLVHPLGVDDMHAYLMIREMLEIKALRLARKQLDDCELEKIRQRCASSADGNLADFDNSLHEYIINTAGNRYIRQFFQQYVAKYYTALFYFAAPETEEVREMANEHLSIVDALMNKNWTEAEKLLSAHILGQETVLMKLLEAERVKHPKKKHLREHT